jgi:hypothetical protein
MPDRPNPPGGRRNPLADEIEAFLREAAQKRGRAYTPPRPTAQRPQPQQTQQPIPAEAVDERRDSVAEDVQRHAAKTRVGMPEAELGKGAAQAAKSVQAHLQQTFDHDVGRLTKLRSAIAPPREAELPSSPVDRVVDAAPAVLASQIAALMRDPAAFRQAFLLGEILHRPEERWR